MANDRSSALQTELVVNGQQSAATRWYLSNDYSANRLEALPHYSSFQVKSSSRQTVTLWRDECARGRHGDCR
jgi:hypothetical protein